MATPTSSNESKGPRKPGIGDDARLLFGAVDSALRETETTLVRMMRERPLVAVGAAAGVGFLLGGGLTPRIATRLVTTGGRMVLAATLERWLVDQLGLTPKTARAREDATRKEARS
ncbi:MAG: hypothetical protein ACREQJ_16460 [Candidatus Binatia bacterium]